MTPTTHRTAVASRPSAVPSSSADPSAPQIPSQRRSGSAGLTTATPPPSDDDEFSVGWLRVIGAIGARAVLVVVSGMLLWALLPSLVGWESTTVMSGSMQPRILAGDLVVARSVDPGMLRPDQILLVDDPDHPGRLRLHRFVAWTPDGELVLRGDANAEADTSPVSLSAVHGVAVLRIPYVGLPIVWAKDHDWARVLAAVGAFVLLAATARLRHDAPTSAAAPRGTPALVPTPVAEPAAEPLALRVPVRVPVPVAVRVATTPTTTGSPVSTRPTVPGSAATPALPGRPAMPLRTFAPRSAAAPGAPEMPRRTVVREPTPSRPVAPLRTFTRTTVPSAPSPAALSSPTGAIASAPGAVRTVPPTPAPHAEPAVRSWTSALRRAAAHLPPSRSLRWAALAVVVVLGGAAVAPQPSQAGWSASTAAAGAFASDTLAPVTGLASTATCANPVIVAFTSGGAGSTVAMTVPANTLPGDVLVFAVSSKDVGATPSGLTAIRSDSAGNSFTTTVYQRVATAADPGTTYSFGTSGFSAGGMVVVRGALGITATGEHSGRESSLTAPAITAGSSNSLLLLLVAAKAKTTYGYPAAMSERYWFQQTSLSIGAASEVLTASGSTGPRTATGTVGTESTAQAVLLRLPNQLPATNSVTLSWTAPAGAQSYAISRDGTAVATVAAPATTWTDAGVADGAHTWTVLAKVGSSWVATPVSTNLSVACS